MEELFSLEATELSSGLKAKKYSSVELTKACLERINSLKQLNSFITVCADSALASAAQADKRIANGEEAELLGIPVALKDIILSKGIQNTCASKILENFIAPYDATVTEKLKNAGAVIVGKTNMDEFAMGSSNENSPYGPVLNPWNKQCVSGGSSGGSAVSVAASMVPFALGTDTGGSIRQPASLCNIVGLKPTYGRVSRYGVVAFASSLDQVGSFARSVRDLALITKVISGHDSLDSTSVNKPVPDFSKSLNQSIKGLRLGIPKEYFIGGLSSSIEKAIKEAISKLESLGAIPVEISLPHTELAVAVYYVLAPAEASSNLARYDGVRFGHRAKTATTLEDLYCNSRSEGFGREVKRRIIVGTYVLSSGYFDAYYLKAQKVRTLIAQDFKNAFDKHCDIIVCPTTPTTAFKIGAKVDDPLSMYLSDVFTIPVNLAGLPGMSVPCGFDEQKLPIGLQMIARPWDEESLFKVASVYEAASSWHKMKPDLS